MAFESIRGLMKKSDLLLMAVCVLFAAVFLVLAASNAANVGSFFTIDSLFFTAVCLLLALAFLAIPAMTLHERGHLRAAFGVPEGITPARRHEGEIHFEGGVRLFSYVLGALLVLTLVEVVLAYVELNLILMLTVLMGLSIIKAALIIAYFMHLKFERMSLVLSLVPALVVCICLLFIFFPDAGRARTLRATRPATSHAAPAPSEAAH